MFGGLLLIHSLSPLRIIRLPLLPFYIAFVHPHFRLDTRTSREVLKHEIPLAVHTRQSAHLAAVISALYKQDYEQFADLCIDELIEPLRAPLIPGFVAVQQAAYNEGALACSLSGSGPTLFAFAKTRLQAESIGEKMKIAFQQAGLQADVLVSRIVSQGAKIIDEH